MYLEEASAFCHDCNYQYSGKNAMGIAAIHNKKTGHTIHCELTYIQYFDGNKNVSQGDKNVKEKV